MELNSLIKANIDGISDDAARKFERYYQMLVEWNSRVNLTAITDAHSVVQKHFADSILPSALLPYGASCIDIGTGAGFPGIPLAIIRPDIEMVLLDSLNKRVDFLKAVCGELDLSLACIHSRGEDAARTAAYREHFDVALTRAVAGVNVLTELSVPFLKTGGISIMLKGPKAGEELALAQTALIRMNSQAELINFNADWGKRCAVVVKKVGGTDNIYPRKGLFKKPL